MYLETNATGQNTTCDDGRSEAEPCFPKAERKEGEEKKPQKANAPPPHNSHVARGQAAPDPSGGRRRLLTAVTAGGGPPHTTHPHPLAFLPLPPHPPACRPRDSRRRARDKRPHGLSDRPEWIGRARIARCSLPVGGPRVSRSDAARKTGAEGLGSPSADVTMMRTVRAPGTARRSFASSVRTGPRSQLRAPTV
ncbi:hypothetical protein NL676_024102 [Syzygium grande]|nr:hypothetical protein NL676_024102 [Syzygium grande]